MTFLEAAERLGARVCRDAVWQDDRCNWIAWHAGAGATRTHGALGPALYSGAAGIALVLLRLYAATGEPIFRRTGEAALRQALARRDPGAIGLFSGLAGIAYVAGCAAGITGEPEYRRQAIEIARALAPCPSQIDIMSGSAGVIAALLALSRLEGGSALVEAARPHAGFLIHNAHRSERGWSWTTMEKCYGDLTGFAHGTAGIAFALLELFHVTGDATCRDAAWEAWRYERAWFSPAAGNWADFRSPPRDGVPRCSVMWCAGAPGIGLARLRAWEVLRDPACRDESQAAIRATLEWLAGAEDSNYSLCHGLAGNAELLLDSGEPEYVRIARGVGETGIQRYEEQGIPWPSDELSESEHPGLMIGLAGIAHFYLRLHDANVPSVLLLTR